LNVNKVLYIGQFQPGTTSYYRGCILKKLLPEAEFSSIDTLEPFYKTPRIFRSVGFRWKTGPLITQINKFIADRLGNGHYDLVWVDKAVFITKETTQKLREIAKCFVHFTPDPAFKFHRSKHFQQSLRYYDTLVTTKSYEVDDYAALVNKRRIVLVTQGFDPSRHYSRKKFSERKPGVCFIGHHENERQEIIEAILKHDIPVFVAGRGCKNFARRQSGNPQLIYGGVGIYGDEYAAILSEYKFGLGLLSKWVPEMHTTRTLEIPACGAVLLTELNSETSVFFDKDEALFFSNVKELLEGLRFLLANPGEAEKMAGKGVRRVQNNSSDYRSIMSSILESVYKESHSRQECN
jgi:spore maturation protein CgeB